MPKSPACAAASAGPREDRPRHERPRLRPAQPKRGAPGRIVDLILAGHVSLLVDDRILAEYHDVLRRGRFGFEAKDVDALVAFIHSTAVHILGTPLADRLSDEDDEPFLEVAIAGEADALVTGNVRHFPSRRAQGARIVNRRPSWHRAAQRKVLLRPTHRFATAVISWAGAAHWHRTRVFP